MKPSYFALAVVVLLSFSSAAQTKAFYHTVHFDSDQWSLSTEVGEDLRRLSDTLRLFDVYSIEIIGHTDADGTQSYNKVLSKNRSESVKNCLLSNRVDPKLISTDYYGETHPIAGNVNENDKFKNRRVQVKVVLRDAEVEEVIPYNQSVWKIYDDLSKEELQKFCIDPTKDTMIVCERGAMVIVPAWTFGNLRAARGPACVEIEVVETHLKSDFLAANLNSVSNNGLIESAGMIYVNAKYDGNPVNPLPDRYITIMFPNASTRNDMKVFDDNGVGKGRDGYWKLSRNEMGRFGYKGGMRRCIYKNYNDCGFWCRIGYYLSFKNPPKYSLKKGDISISNKYKTQLSKYAKNLEDLTYRQSLRFLREEYGVKTDAELIAKLNEEVEAEEAKRKQEIELNIDNGQVNSGDLEYYVFQMPGMGWANCDAFYDVPKDLVTSVDIDLPANDRYDVKMVFANRNIIVSGYKKEKSISFSGIPKGESVFIVAVSNLNGKPGLCIQKYTVGNEVKPIVFEELDSEELKARLNALNAEFKNQTASL